MVYCSIMVSTHSSHTCSTRSRTSSSMLFIIPATYLLINSPTQDGRTLYWFTLVRGATLSFKLCGIYLIGLCTEVQHLGLDIFRKSRSWLDWGNLRHLVEKSKDFLPHLPFFCSTHTRRSHPILPLSERCNIYFYSMEENLQMNFVLRYSNCFMGIFGKAECFKHRTDRLRYLVENFVHNCINFLFLVFNLYLYHKITCI